MTERTIFIFESDITGNIPISYIVPREVMYKIVCAIAERPELIGTTFHDKESGNFYKAVYSI